MMAALAGCAAHPRQAAMVAATPQSSFGYSETKLSPTRYEVRYATPALKLPADAESRASAVEKEKQRAFDLALWHAAEIALAGGFTELSIGPAHRDADLQVKKLYTPAAPGVFGPGGMIYPQWIYNPMVAYYGAPGIGPYWMYEDPFADQPEVVASGRITARLEVTFARTASPGSLDAAATARRLAAEYAGSAY
ncbi:MAG TPA: hypothetical protein VIE35_08475 [Dongiaceae bacterium]